MKNEDYAMTNFTEEEYQKISERLSYLRTSILQINQIQCSKALGISQTYLSMLESGKKRVSSQLVSLYVEHFNVSVNWLLTGDESMGIVGGDASKNADYYIQKKQYDSLLAIKNAYNLDKTESEFLTRLFTMEPSKRKHFIKIINDLKEF